MWTLIQLFFGIIRKNKIFMRLVIKGLRNMHAKGKYHRNLSQGILIRRDKGSCLFDISMIEMLDKDLKVSDGKSGDFRKLIDIIKRYISNIIYH